MTLRHTENNVSTTGTANKFLELTNDNILPVLDGSALTGFPNTEPIIKYINQSTINLNYNAVTLIDNYNFNATTINIPDSANTGDKIIIVTTRAGLNNITLVLPTNHRLYYKGNTVTDNFLIDTSLFANSISKASDTKYHGFSIVQFLCYNDGTNINWMNYTGCTTLEEYELTIYNNLLDYQTLGYLNTDSSLNAVNPNIAYYKIPSTYASTSFSATTQTEYVSAYNKSRFVLIVDNAIVNTINLPYDIGSNYHHFTIVKTNLAAQDITVNIGSIANAQMHTSNSAFGALTNTFVLTGTRSTTILNSIYWTVYYATVMGES